MPSRRHRTSLYLSGLRHYLGMFRVIVCALEWVAIRRSLGPELLPLHGFIQRELAAFFYGDHAVNVFVSRHGDVDDIVSRLEIELQRRRFIQNKIVDCNLRAFGLNHDVDGTNASRDPATK